MNARPCLDGTDDQSKVPVNVRNEDEEYEDEESEKDEISSALYIPHASSSLVPTISSPVVKDAPEKNQIDQESLDLGDRFEKSIAARSRHSLIDESHQSYTDLDSSGYSDDEVSGAVSDGISDSSGLSDEELGRDNDDHVVKENRYKGDLEPYSPDFKLQNGLVSSPKQKPKKKKKSSTSSHHSMKYYHAQAATQPEVPLGAVELKPYNHQVGGHTALFRFSRRAVCKSLSNRENEFYEAIEKRHPSLLKFLPRYAPPIITLNGPFAKVHL